MNFKEKLKNYACLLVSHGINVQPGQIVQITCEPCHRELAAEIVELSYKRGAKYVNIDFIDPCMIHARLAFSQRDEDLGYVPPYIPAKFDDLIEQNGAVLRLIGSEFPDSLADLPPQKVNKYFNAYRQSLKNYYTEGVGKSKIHWTVAAASTPKWGKKIFPDLDENQACEALWEEIFKICRADKPDCLEIWKKHNEMLHTRARRLTELKIEELHFQGPQTDLKVYLSPKALFKAGGDLSPRGVEFEPNIPTEECFTTPDFRRTEGYAQVTRPILVNGKMIKNLHLEFKEGKITRFQASEGEQHFAEYINNDEGARRLGEVALVGTDSPIYQSGRVFEEILFDENAACHIAVGFAYRFCLEGGASMDMEELKALGCNESNVHVDMMISSDKVDVAAKTYAGKSIPLIEKGKWVNF